MAEPGSRRRWLLCGAMSPPNAAPSISTYAAAAAEVEQHRRAFIRKWRLKYKAVADSLEQAGDRLFTFTRLPLSQMEERAHHQCNRTAP
jgi:hypothetical protein